MVSSDLSTKLILELSNLETELEILLNAKISSDVSIDQVTMLTEVGADSLNHRLKVISSIISELVMQYADFEITTEKENLKVSEYVVDLISVSLAKFLYKLIISSNSDVAVSAALLAKLNSDSGAITKQKMLIELLNKVSESGE